MIRNENLPAVTSDWTSNHAHLPVRYRYRSETMLNPAKPTWRMDNETVYRDASFV